MRWFRRNVMGMDVPYAPSILVRPHGGAEVAMPKAYAGDAGFDLACTERCIVYPGEYAEIPCGFDIELPEGVWAMIHPRSSTARRGLLVNTSVIDNGYRGPMFVGVTNVKAPGEENSEVIEKGERVAQLIPMPLLAPEIVVYEVDALSASDRGTAGFGSTGS